MFGYLPNKFWHVMGELFDSGTGGGAELAYERWGDHT